MDIKDTICDVIISEYIVVILYTIDEYMSGRPNMAILMMVSIISIVVIMIMPKLIKAW